jgi:hypothetical protein
MSLSFMHHGLQLKNNLPSTFHFLVTENKSRGEINGLA